MTSNTTRDPATNQLQTYSNLASPTPLLTSNGAPVDSLTASSTAGKNGPIVLQDFTLIDHLASFDRERIPERVVHAKGAGAFGYFEVTKDDVIRSICKADLFKGTKPNMLMPFITPSNMFPLESPSEPCEIILDPAT